MLLRRFAMTPQSRKILFDLDQTLWPFTVEYNDYDPNKIESYRQPQVHEFMKVMQQVYNSELHITSRSSKPEKCNEILDILYPDIKFTSKQIFATNAPYKTSHVLNAIGLQEAHFTMFDDELPILNHIKQKFPLSYTLHAPLAFYKIWWFE